MTAGVLFAVVATEDDYYPDIQTIGVFADEAEALKFAAAQPRAVYRWPEHAGLATHKRFYDYTVVVVPASPSGDWALRAE